MYKNCIKRLIDIVLSFFLFIILIPLLLIMGLITLLNMGFPIVFTQVRVGYNKEVFSIYKFRTMKKKGSVPERERTNKLGRLIRKSGLDELLQLINIFKGDMSFVGPRPFIYKEKLPPYPIDEVRYSVKPGVFGMAQAGGRREISHEMKIDFDVYYAKNVSFGLDIKLFFKSIGVVISQLFSKE